MARERSVDRDLRRLAVADFTDHDDVRVLTQEGAQRTREGQPDVLTHQHLIDARHLVLDRIFGRQDAHLHLVDLVQKSIERGRLARPGGAGHQKDAVGAVDQLDHMPVVEIVKPEIAQLDEIAGLLQQTQRNRFAVSRRHRGHADVDVIIVEPHADAAVHRQPLLRDIQVRHDLDARDDRRLEPVELRRHVHLVKHAVNPVPDAQLILHRLDMDICRALTVRFRDNLVHELHDRGLGPDLVHIDLGDRGQIGVHRVAAVLNHLFDRVGAHAIILLNCLVDLFARAERHPHRAARRQPQAVRHPGVERITSDHRQHTVLHRQRQHVVLVHRARRQPGERLIRRPRLRQLGVGKSQHLADLAQKLILAGQAQAHHRARDARAVRTVSRQHMRELNVGK